MARSTRSGGTTAPQNPDAIVQQQSGSSSNTGTGGSTNHTGGSTPTVITGSNATSKPSMPTKFDLPLLNDDGSNYNLWSRTLTLVLQKHGFWPIVNGSEIARCIYQCKRLRRMVPQRPRSDTHHLTSPQRSRATMHIRRTNSKRMLGHA